MRSRFQCFQPQGKNSYILICSADDITLHFFLIWQTYYIFSITVETVVIFSAISAPREEQLNTDADAQPARVCDRCMVIFSFSILCHCVPLLLFMLC